MIHFVLNYGLQISFFSFLLICLFDCLFFVCLFVCLFVSNALLMVQWPVKPNWNLLYCIFHLQNFQLTVLSDSYRKICLVVYIGWSLNKYTNFHDVIKYRIYLNMRWLLSFHARNYSSKFLKNELHTYKYGSITEFGRKIGIA